MKDVEDQGHSVKGGQGHSLKADHIPSYGCWREKRFRVLEFPALFKSQTVLLLGSVTEQGLRVYEVS